MASVSGLPRRLVASLNGSIDATGDLPAFQRELLERMRSMDEGIGALRQTMEAVQGDVALVAGRCGELERTTRSLEQKTGSLVQSVDAGLSSQLKSVQSVMLRVETLIGQLTERLPDPNARGPLAKARQAITGAEGPGPGV